MPRHCAHCGTALDERGRFCHRCGAPRDGSAPPARASAAPTSAAAVLPWVVAGIALLALLGFIAGQQWGRGRPAAPPVAAGGPSGRAVDISQMSPQERADRLFQRVMTYVSAGQGDSVMFFAPMAIQSFEALAPLDAHQRYDVGLLAMVSGDAELARAQADSILQEQPTHLLGLTLAMRTAGMQNDAAARASFAQRLLAALERERAELLPEYEDHGPDIDAAVREATAPPTAPAR